MKKVICAVIWNIRKIEVCAYGFPYISIYHGCRIDISKCGGYDRPCVLNIDIA